MKNRYRDYNSYLKNLYGMRVQKISLDAGMGCPNRDGLISGKGCIYCDPMGSGTGAKVLCDIPVKDQLSAGIEWADKKYKDKKYIAYFQSYTNTYASVDLLKDLYTQALDFKDMVGLSVGTRPDCVDCGKLELLNSFSNDYLVWIEYGLQSSHDKTLDIINRGHDVKAFTDAVKMTVEYDINICAHVILGLPGETKEMMMETARFIADQPLGGVKIHSLYVTKGTELAKMYLAGEFKCMEREEYIETLIDFLELLPPEYIIQRVTGDPYGESTLAPEWALHKSASLNLFNKRLKERDTWQGKRYKTSSAGR